MDDQKISYELRPVMLDDEAFLATLYGDVHAGEFAPLGLPPQALEQLLAMQFRAQMTGYAAQFPDAIGEIVWVDGERVGRLLVDRTPREFIVVDIALLRAWCGKGLGSEILRRIADRAKFARLPVRLSVRIGNPAQRLYERLGFLSAGSDGVNLSMEIPAAGDAAKPVDAEGWTEAVPEKVEPGLTSAYFRSLVGERFTARLDDLVMELVLHSVKRIKPPPRQSGWEMGDSFDMTFYGPPTTFALSHTVELQHGDEAPLELHLVAVGSTDEAAEYQALFNRMVPS